MRNIGGNVAETFYYYFFNSFFSLLFFPFLHLLKAT